MRNVSMTIMVFMGSAFPYSRALAEDFWKQTWNEFTSPVTQESKYYFLEGVAFTALIASENMDKEYCG